MYCLGRTLERKIWTTEFCSDPFPKFLVVRLCLLATGDFIGCLSATAPLIDFLPAYTAIKLRPISVKERQL